MRNAKKWMLAIAMVASGVQMSSVANAYEGSPREVYGRIQASAKQAWPVWHGADLRLIVDPESYLVGSTKHLILEVGQFSERAPFNGSADLMADGLWAIGADRNELAFEFARAVAHDLCNHGHKLRGLNRSGEWPIGPRPLISAETGMRLEANKVAAALLDVAGFDSAEGFKRVMNWEQSNVSYSIDSVNPMGDQKANAEKLFVLVQQCMRREPEAY